MVTYPESWRQWRTLLVHDWLTGMRGGERVLEWLCRGFPDAPIYTLIHNPAAVSDTINAHPIRVSWLGRVPGIARHYRRWLPLFPAAIESFRAEPTDLVLSTSHCVAKGFRPPPGARHVCYCFTPMRYAWTFHDEYLGRGWRRRLAAPLLARLRAWDRAANARVDCFITLSEHVRERIRRFYGRDADVVHPPADTDYFTPGPAPDAGAYDLIVSALVPYKRIGLAVRAYAALGFPLRIVGTGTEFERLRRDAPPNVTFLGRRSDDQVRTLYRGCRLLIFPGEEDFGIVPVEAQACGRPVVAFGVGGVRESVVADRTGVFFDEPTPEALADAVRRAAARRWNPEEIRAQALRFSPPRFIEGLDRCLTRAMSEPPARTEGMSK